MDQAVPRSCRIAVIGGGITGLAAAHRLSEIAPQAQVTLLESGDRLGGVLFTQQRDGFLLEQSADNFITSSPWALDLCRRIEMADELLATDETLRRAYVVHRGRLEHVPEGFLLLVPRRLGPLLRSPILSWPGKLRLLAEYFVPRRVEQGDESLADFARRRLGHEVYQRLVQPLVGGIYTADAEKLSIQAALPRFVEMERKHGSLIRAMRRETSQADSSGARYSMFVAPRRGFTHLVQKLASRLPAETVRLNSAVRQIQRQGGKWLLHMDRLPGQAPAGQLPSPAPETFDSVIITTPATQAAMLLEAVDSDLSADLARIEYAGCAIALIAYRREQIAHKLDGFGVVVPEVEGRQILAISFSSLKYAGRAPDRAVLLRVFLGGARRPDLVDLPEEALRRLVALELEELLGARGEPLLFEIRRWHKAMPQYHLGHVELVARIEARVSSLTGLELAGNAYHGVGVPDCIHSGEQAAERIAAFARLKES